MHPRASHTWYPCTQMKEQENASPLDVESAKGCYIRLKDGQELFDAISSWWCKSLGHGHPRLQAAITRQMSHFEHVMMAGTTNKVIQVLSSQLAQLTKTLPKVFYTGDGSCAVEVAMKMSVHAHQMKGEMQRTRFLSLQNSYHGDTVGTLSVGDLGIYRDPYRSMMFAADTIGPLPYVRGEDDPLWHNCELHWQRLLPQLEAHKEIVTAVLVEPIVQGAGGMKIYSQDFLRRLRKWTVDNGIHLIADEIMTGCGRTGKMLASEHAGIEADFVCLSKGLTSGWLPLSVTLTSQTIYDLFYDDYEKGKSFLHSHTYSANALAASVAVEALTIMQELNICEKANHIGQVMRAEMQKIAEKTGMLDNVRGIGAIAAADINRTCKGQRASMAVFREAAKQGLLLRPIGQTVYWLPPLIADEQDLMALADKTMRCLYKIF